MDTHKISLSSPFILSSTTRKDMRSHRVPISRKTLAELWALRKEFSANRAIWIPSARMIPICSALGASKHDIETIQTVSERLRNDPTLSFRYSKVGRFMLDMDKQHIRRLENQPYILSPEEDFIRHDSGKLRNFDEIDENLQQNTVLHALLRFKAFMFHGIEHKHRPKLDYGTNESVCTFFNLRTFTQRGVLGEPALEGVHSDGVDLTMSTLLGHQNMSDNSAITFLHSNEEKNGTRWNEIDPKLLVRQVQHKDFLDTLLFFDHEHKHSLSPVWQVDESKPALRDILIFFTRKPVEKEHSSYPYESLSNHTGMPMQLDLNVIDSI